MNELKIFCFGNFQVQINEKTIDTFESHKVRALLAYLASQGGQNFHREKLAGFFWPDMPDTNARRNLNQAIYNLKNALSDRENSPSFLLINRETVQFNQDSQAWVDVLEIERYIGNIEAHGESPEVLCPECILNLKFVENLYRGEFLENIQVDHNNGFGEWIINRRENFHQKFLISLAKLVRYYESNNLYNKALVYARKMYELDPLLEKNVRILMRLLALTGQRNAALILYSDLETVLGQELGVQPEVKTKELADQLSQETLDPSKFNIRVNTLPSVLTPTIGRDEEIRKLCQLLMKPGCRLLTILGPGGSGKTRLGIEVGWEMLTAYRNGISWIDVNTLKSIETLPAALANALEFPLQKQGDVFEQLLKFISTKEILLIFDGFENLQDGLSVITTILKNAPDCNVLVTSRARLNVKAEHIFTLSGLAYLTNLDNNARTGNNAIRLFIDAAKRINPDFQPNEDELKAILEICQIVDGMPLGILLSAAWINVYNPNEIAKEVKESLSFLSTGWEDLPDRQRSLRASFDYSWRLLSDQERRVAQYLSIFQGVFSRNAIQEITGTTAYMIGQLESKSLLQRQAAGYYRMHELVRYFAREKLTENAELWQQAYNAHCLYYLNNIELWNRQLKSAHQARAISKIDLEHENIRAAWESAISVKNSDLIIRACEGLCTYYDLRVRFQEGKSACEQALAAVPADQLDSLILYIWQLHFQRLLNETEYVLQGLFRCLEILQSSKHTSERKLRAYGLVNYELGMANFYVNYQEARKFLSESIKIFDENVYNWELMNALIALGEILHLQSDFKSSQEIVQQAVLIAYRVGEPQHIAQVLRRQAYNSLYMGDYNLAVQQIRESIRFHNEAGDPGSLAMVQIDYANLLCILGEFSSARVEFDKVIPVLHHLGFQNEFLRASMFKNLMEIWTGDYVNPKKTLDENLRIAEQVGDQRAEAGFKWVKGQMLFLEGDPSGAEQFLLESIEQYTQINQLEELSGSLAMLAIIYSLGGDQEHMIRALSKSYRIAMQSLGIQGVSFTLVATILHEMNQGDIATALELASMVRKIPAVDNIVWWQDTIFNPVMRAAEQLPEEIRREAIERGRNGDIFETLPRMAHELGFGEPV